MRGTLVSLLLLVPSLARAQAPTIDPSGRTPPAPPPTAQPGATTGVPGGIYGIDQPPPPPPVPEIRVVLPSGGQVEQPGKEKEPEGLYLGGGRALKTPQQPEAVVPETYVVQPGDTLWDICAQFFGDPHLWPRVWAMNPTITNPHWIYPGDMVKLREPGAPTPVAERSDTPTAPPAERPTEPARLRRVAFVSLADLKVSGEIVGSAEERLMLASGDEIYVSYAEGQPPLLDAVYAVYSPTKDVIHPVTGQKVGAYVQILGDARILDVKKGKNAHGIILAVGPEGVIERGNRVGPLKTQFQPVTPVPADKSVEGIIVAILHVDQLIGEGQLVVLDRGTRHGIAVGNTMLAVRRGDAYIAEKGGELGAGRDDRRFPDRYLADLVILDVAEGHSLGLVTRSEREILIGDHVMMRAPRK